VLFSIIAILRLNPIVFRDIAIGVVLKVLYYTIACIKPFGYFNLPPLNKTVRN
jgi:hypothetical protein